ncbi:MAG: alpha/beta hydrolase [Nanoarchaeota archaeon]|nr:alpha/beta hydrolase [Nanoarchaeota archaeon]
MPKRVFIIHGWSGNPPEGWFPWLKKELEKKGFHVEVPAMPDTDYPKIEAWVSFLKKAIKNPDTETYLVGHSIGCQAILRYLQGANIKIGGAVFVAGWLTLRGLETDEEWETAKPWLETQIDFGKAKKCLLKCVAIFSDNDPFVPLDNSNIFREKLGAKIIIEKQKGHFSGSDKIVKLPSVLKELLEMME